MFAVARGECTERLDVARNPVLIRDAQPEDAAALVEVWSDATGGKPSRLSPPGVEEAARAVARIAIDADQRLVVGILDDVVAGVASVRRATLTPIHDETAVLVDHLYVHCDHRRRGVGRALVAAAAAWADEKQSPHLMASVAAASRDANRFLARLGLAQITTVRAAPVTAVVQKLAALETPHGVEGKLVTARRRALRRRHHEVALLPLEPAPILPAVAPQVTAEQVPTEH